MNVDFQDIVNHGISFKYSPTSLSPLTLNELRHLIFELNALSEQLGCVVFEGDGSSKTDLVIFGGNLERFSMLSVARGLGSRVFYFQSPRTRRTSKSYSVENNHFKRWRQMAIEVEPRWRPCL